MDTTTPPLNPLRNEFGVQEPDAAASLDDVLAAGDAALQQTGLDIFHSYLSVFVAAFVVTLIAAPILRRLAIANGVIDRPDDPRKSHRVPVAYLGGVAVFLGITAGIAVSFFFGPPVFQAHESAHFMKPVPIAVILGMTVIMVTGLIDDIVGISPRIKIAGQLFAAAALAMQDVGVKVAQGLLAPLGRSLGREDLMFLIPMPEFLPIFGGEPIPIDVIYWVGTAIIAIFILGACNASNLIDGLDGLLSGVTAIAAAGLLIVAIGLALADDGVLDGSRIVLCLCLLGACLGFLPHNFNPATIFLGDAGSLLMGYLTIVIILSLGDTGRTPLVVAGLVIYSLPIIDTTLAIIRRKLARRSISDADDQHLHHMLLRALGVKRSVFVMYGIAISFAALGVLVSVGRARVAYTVAFVLASFIIVTAIKIARRAAIEADISERAARPKRAAGAKRTNGRAKKPTKTPDPVGS